MDSGFGFATPLLLPLAPFYALDVLACVLQFPCGERSDTLLSSRPATNLTAQHHCCLYRDGGQILSPMQKFLPDATSAKNCHGLHGLTPQLGPLINVTLTKIVKARGFLLPASLMGRDPKREKRLGLQSFALAPTCSFLSDQFISIWMPRPYRNTKRKSDSRTLKHRSDRFFRIKHQLRMVASSLLSFLPLLFPLTFFTRSFTSLEKLSAPFLVPLLTISADRSR